jgi:glycosyltransferase involved in cell wall biosynthesis
MKLLKEKYNDIEELTLVNELRERINYYFNASQLHLLTSDYEGSPNSVKESLSCNTPVVSTNVGNVSDILTGVKHSELILSGDVQDLFNACCRLLDDLDKEVLTRDEIKKKALDIDSKAKELVGIYKKIIKS